MYPLKEINILRIVSYLLFLDKNCVDIVLFAGMCSYYCICAFEQLNVFVI